MSANHLSSLANLSFSWTCPLTRTGKRSAHSTCAKEFAKEMGFQLIETSDDGNCFFYTLTKFGKRSGYAPFLLDRNEHENAMALREQLVDHIQENLHEYAHFISNNDSGSVNHQVEELREDGAWAADIGDLVPVAGANAFGVHINLYNILNAGDRDLVQLVPIRSQQPTSVFVSIMRVREGHFQLLWPRSGEFHESVPSSSSSASYASYASYSSHRLSPPNEKDAVAAAKMAVQAAQVAVQAAKATSRHVSPLKNKERQLNQMIQNLNQLSLGGPRRSTRSTRSSAPSYVSESLNKPKPKRRTTKRKSPSPRNNGYENSNNELRRALEQSLYNR